MPLRYWFKIGVLVLALSATMVSIFWLKQGHMAQFWSSLGFRDGSTLINWCDERVSTVHFYNKSGKITEEAGKWLWRSKGKTDVTLNYLDVEKWFAKYCQVPFESVQEAQATDAGEPILEMVFITGDRLSFHKMGESQYKIRGKVYESKSLREALKELLAFDPKIE